MEGDGVPVVLIHGFTQTMRSWDEAVLHLPPARYTRVDLPGHGTSSHDRPDFEEAATLIATRSGKAAYMGYSMGGRFAMRIAVDHPETVTALVCIGSDPGIEDARERSLRREADLLWANLVEEIGVEPFLKEWLAQPIFDGVPESSIAHRLANEPAGLAWAMRAYGTGAMSPMWGLLSAIETPTLFVAGEADARYRDLIVRAADLMPNASVAIVKGCGHAPHIESPKRFAEVVGPFLHSMSSSSSTNDS